MRFSGAGSKLSWTDGQQVSLSLTAPAARPNRPPKVSASCDPCDVSPGGEVRLTATASDPDGDQLFYRWSAKEGSFIGVRTIIGVPSRPTARWQAPPVAGRYPVTVVVFDRPNRSGASASSTVEINVNSPPTVSLSCEGMCRVRQGLSVQLTATASDPDGHELSYSWSADSGSFIGETDGATARWQAPAEAGAMTVSVMVSDEQGGSTSAEVDVAVDPLSNQSAVFASYLVSMPSDDPGQVIDTYLSVSNVLSAPEGVETAGGPYEGDDKVGTLEIHLYGRDDDEPMIHETTGDSPGSGLDENGRLAPGQTYTVRLAELVGEDRAFVGYGWIVGNFDGISGTRTIINFGQGVTVHGDLTPKLSRHGAGVKPIPPQE
ncbi:MAG: PKD domain-containing protein [Acidobacteriota bacterium]|nr:PKD domain-containing protein [Acidobacteriota bacterium]